MIEPGAYPLQHDQVYNDVKFFQKFNGPSISCILGPRYVTN